MSPTRNSPRTQYRH